MNVMISVLYGWLAQSKKNHPQIRFLFETSNYPPLNLQMVNMTVC